MTTRRGAGIGGVVNPNTDADVDGLYDSLYVPIDVELIEG